MLDTPKTDTLSSRGRKKSVKSEQKADMAAKAINKTTKVKMTWMS